MACRLRDLGTGRARRGAPLRWLPGVVFEWPRPLPTVRPLRKPKRSARNVRVPLYDASMSTLERRLTIWRLLAAAGPRYSLLELARRFGVSKNAIARDLDALSAAGVPITE